MDIVNLLKFYFCDDPRKDGLFNKKTDGDFKKNLGENIGDAMVWHITTLPRHIFNFLNDPRVQVIALGIFTILAIQFAFYPVASYLAVKYCITLVIPFIKLWAVKLAICIFAEFTAAGYCVRAAGRACNSNLPAKFIEAQKG